jgi:hypothetical protein
MKAQNNVTVQDQDGNSSKPLLSSRLFKFRAWDVIDKEFINIDNIPLKELQQLFRTEVMQFTGLKDKKGTEIYEGDILQFITNGFDAETFITTIIFDKCSFKLQNNRSLFYFGQSDFTKVDDAIVIGNIFENPELL